MIAGMHLNKLAITEDQSCAPLKNHHPLMFGLVVLKALGADMAGGNDSLDPNALGNGENFNEFLGQRLRDLGV